MHPLEQLRYVARGWESTAEVPIEEVAQLLADLAELSPATLLHACRRLIEYFPSCGRLWWLAARALAAPEQVEGIWEALAEIESDPTATQLVRALPADARVTLVGPTLPEVRRAIRRAREGSRHKRGPAQRLLVVTALAGGPEGLLVDAGSTAQLASTAQATIWGVVPRGTVLPEPLWRRLLAWAGSCELLEAGALSALVGPSGVTSARELLATPQCPPVAELLSWKS